MRAIKLAEKFKRPIVTFIDTPGAYPGIDAEERGQAEAIAYNLREMASLRVPIIVIVLGEGGSGGALAIGIGDRIIMLENAVYSVISPEGCAAILWKDAARSDQAAESLRLTANDLMSFGLIDEIVKEPKEWKIPASESPESQQSFETIAADLKSVVVEGLEFVANLDEQERHLLRYKKFRKMGEWV